MVGRRFLVAAGIVVALLMLVAVALSAVLRFHGLTVVISEQQIREAVEQRFPATRNYLGILSVTYRDPVVGLDAGDDRVRIGITASPQIVIGGKLWSGTLLVEGGLRYEPATGQCFLTGFKVVKAEIEDLPQTKHLNEFARCVALFDDIFAKRPIYTLDDGDFKQRTARMLVKGIRVHDHAVEIFLGL